MSYRRGEHLYKEIAEEANKNKGRPYSTWEANPNTQVLSSAVDSWKTNTFITTSLPSIEEPSLNDIKKSLNYNGIKKVLHRHGITRSDRTIRAWAQKNTLPKKLHHLYTELTRNSIIEKNGGEKKILEQTGISKKRLYNWKTGKTQKTAPEIARLQAQETINKWFQEKNIRSTSINANIEFTIHTNNGDYDITRSMHATAREVNRSLARELAINTITGNTAKNVQDLTKYIEHNYMKLDESSSITNITITNIHELDIDYKKT